MEGTNSPGTLLRIKRRLTDDSFSTLSVQPNVKRSKISEDASGEVKLQLFQFVGRVKNEGTLDYGKLLENSIKTQEKKKACSQSIDASSPGGKKIVSRLEKRRQETPSSNTFKVVPLKRQKFDEENSDKKDHETEPENSNFLRMFDVVPDAEPDASSTKSRQEERNGTSIVFREDTITCNAVAMIREKLTLNDTPVSPEYCYDLYYTPHVELDRLDQMLVIDPIEEDIFMISEMDDDLKETYDDDEDSNDENNPRNDYPDEEWGYPSDEEERYNSDSSDDLTGGHDDFRKGTERLRFDPYYEENEEYDFEAYEEYD